MLKLQIKSSVLVHRGPVEKSVQKYHNYVVRSHGITKDKHMARRAYRRVNKITTTEITKDPELYEDEVFDAPFLDSWNVW